MEKKDSSSVSSQGHYEPVDGVRSQSAKSPPSVASPCSQANEQLDAPPAVATGAASAMTEPADITACPSGLPRHRDNIQDNNNVAEGDCPSSCPPVWSLCGLYVCKHFWPCPATGAADLGPGGTIRWPRQSHPNALTPAGRERTPWLTSWARATFE